MGYGSTDSSGYSPGFRSLQRIISASNRLQAELAKTLEPFGITLAQFNVLQVLDQSNEACLTCSEIGQGLLDRTPDVTRLLDRLEKQNLVQRSRSEADRRVVEVAISEKGLDVIREIQPSIDHLVVSLTAPLSNVEHHLLSEYLDRLSSVGLKQLS